MRTPLIQRALGGGEETLFELVDHLDDGRDPKDLRRVNGLRFYQPDGA